jgi:hypothetical protein
LDGEGFILQVHGVFTRIRSGSTLAALGGGALGSTATAMCAGSESGQDLFEMATTAMGGVPKGFWFLFISQNGPPTARRISPRSADSAAARDPSYSTSRRASPRGLGYFYFTTWEATRLRSISGHILQDDPSIREEVLDSRLGGSVPRVLRFFLRIFQDILAKTSDGPSARAYNST